MRNCRNQAIDAKGEAQGQKTTRREYRCVGLEVSWRSFVGEVSWRFRGRFRGQTDLTLWANRTSLRFKGEFALATIGNYLFPGPSLLRG
jgi:hypothetical protein